MKRWISAIIVMALAATLYHVAAITYNPLYGASEWGEEEEETDIKLNMNTLTLWYTDEALSDYLQSAALIFQNNYGVKVNLELKSGVEFLEGINEASISEDTDLVMPDLYITNHDNLLRAYLAGLADVISDPEDIVNSRVFPETALHASTCYGEYVAYPLYFETNYFLYNKTYMASIAQNKLESEQDLIEGNEAQEAADAATEEENAAAEESDASENEVNEEENGNLEENQEEASLESEFEDPMGDEDVEASPEVLERLATMIPATLEDVTTFANNYDAPETVESVFKWDVTDIFYNYFFVGNYMDVGGEDGDNSAVFNIYNQQAVQCLEKYQDMNQFFTIDSKNDTYDNILQDFIDGKMVFTVATTDAIAKINQAKKDGNFPFEYGVTSLPDIDSLLKTKGLSVTDVVAINGYSSKKEMANLFASSLVNAMAGELYKDSGKVACNKNVQHEDGELANIMAEYEKSVPLPKMVEAANYWVQLEIAFTKVWNGADPDETLRELSDTIGGQIEEIRISIPTQESIRGGINALLW